MDVPEDDDRLIRRRVLVSGHVQGVFFRASTAEQARMQHVDGWTRNLDDGRVEAVFEGRAGAVAKLVEFCRVGPDDARVTDVTVHDEDVLGEQGFAVS
jgi:acylphosphatase